MLAFLLEISIFFSILFYILFEIIPFRGYPYQKLRQPGDFNKCTRIILRPEPLELGGTTGVSAVFLIRFIHFP